MSLFNLFKKCYLIKKHKIKNLIVIRRNNTNQPTMYSNQLYHETDNSSDIYKVSVKHVEKCSFL